MKLSSLVYCGVGIISLFDAVLGAPISCPDIGANPVEINVPPRNLQLRKSTKNSLCNLVHVKHTDPSNTTDVTITNNSPGSDYILGSIARSYNGHEWESVSGPFSSRFKVRRCGKNKCYIKLRIAGKYFLMSSNYSTTSFDQTLSRFFIQTTFGPTKDMIATWTYEKNNKGMAKWVKDQTNLPPTKHREYFRRHANYLPFNNTSGDTRSAIQHPCAEYSHWRRHAFMYYDNFQDFEVIALGAQFLILVNGAPRTIVDSFNSADGEYSGAGSYTFCWIVLDRPGGYTEFRPKGSQNSCSSIVGGNPSVYLTTEVIQDYISIVKFINLPDQSNFEVIPPIMATNSGSDRLISETLRMNVPGGLFSANPTQCNALDGNYQFVIGKIVNGELVLYAGNGLIMENTIQNPLPDGGMAAVNDGGKICSNVARNFLNIESCFLANSDACQASSYGRNQYDWRPKIVKNAVICGSDGEVANDWSSDPSEARYSFFGHSNNLLSNGLYLQTKSVPYMIFLNANDQLRQKMAWALSQILVITPSQVVSDFRETEIFLNYYDIFVRNAFGNYRDILREVSYSPMMAEMLSFLESRSASYVLRTEGRSSRPDENYAREIMQLFSIGLYELNLDGSLKKSEGNPILTYENSDIQTFATAWTGFKRQSLRFNMDAYIYNANRMDPMAIEGRWRDPFPKMDLYGGFIGDGYPLCHELPDKPFLRHGATYRLVGSAERAEFQYEHPYHNYTQIERFVLNSNSALYQKLCNADQTGICNFRPLIHLDVNLDCFDSECGLDNLNLVIIEDDIKYEYIRPACVEHAFYESLALKKIVSRHKDAMCLHSNIDDVAMQACCVADDPGHYLNGWAEIFCDFSLERNSYSTSQSRCKSMNITNFPNPDTCDWARIRTWTSNENDRTKCFQYLGTDQPSWHWTNQTCSIQAKVNGDGLISIIHDPNLDKNSILTSMNTTLQSVYQPVSLANTNYFKVKWEGSGEYPEIANQCGNNACQAMNNDCLCNIEVRESRVFKSIPSEKDIKSKLKIGIAPPESYDGGIYRLKHNESGVMMYRRDGKGRFSKHTVFGIQYRGKMTYFKNMQSIIEVSGSTGEVPYQFRNPPQFLNIAKPDTRDAVYETEAVLDHYFYHSNTAPFLASRFIKRFGFSNPSPRFIKVAATAFQKGSYKKGKVTFGDGNYGNLEAVVAAIVLDREARSVTLDADPTTGSLREPLIKLISYMRAMEYKSNANITAVMMDHLQDFIGQEIHAAPNVFSFFLPEFSPTGKISEAALTSPESQILDSPKVVGFLNGIFSLVDIGLSNCFGGFGDLNTWWCDGYNYRTTDEMFSRGYLTFEPSNNLDGAVVVDEIALLLTGGRLNSNAKTILVDTYNQELRANGSNAALSIIQKLIVTTPDYHSTNNFESTGEPRSEYPQPQPSNEKYQAIVYLNLDGGLDSFNVLVPHSNCQGDTAEYTMFDEYTKVRGDIALAKGTLHTITTTGQICTTFGLHPNLPFIKSLYESNDLAFIANMGVLQTPLTKEDWRQKSTETALFAHNTQQDEINKVDIFDSEAGRGVCGRMLDILGLNGFKPGSISVNGVASTLRSVSSPTIVVDSSGYQKFNPTSTLTTGVSDKLKELNKASSIRSSMFGETWSNLLFQALGENELMYEELSNIYLNATFPETDLGSQLGAVAKVMKTKDIRGTDRDVFNVKIGGFDLHSQIEAPLIERLTTINDALEAFVIEMRDHQEIWDDVVVVVVSEFARTLMGNTGNGSDHAWGGNYFVASGSLAGGKILGSFPSNLTNDGDFVFEPGITIPTTPWEALWNGIAQWFGITNTDDLNTVIPNRNSFPSRLFSLSDMFN